MINATIVPEFFSRKGRPLFFPKVCNGLFLGLFLQALSPVFSQKNAYTFDHETRYSPLPSAKSSAKSPRLIAPQNARPFHVFCGATVIAVTGLAIYGLIYASNMTDNSMASQWHGMNGTLTDAFNDSAHHLGSAPFFPENSMLNNSLNKTFIDTMIHDFSTPHSHSSDRDDLNTLPPKDESLILQALKDGKKYLDTCLRQCYAKYYNDSDRILCGSRCLHSPSNTPPKTTKCPWSQRLRCPGYPG